MNVSVLEADKIVVGTNDVSFTAPDQSPTGTAVLNGPVYAGKTSASPGYVAVLNVTSNSAIGFKFGGPNLSTNFNQNLKWIINSKIDLIYLKRENIITY